MGKMPALPNLQAEVSVGSGAIQKGQGNSNNNFGTQSQNSNNVITNNNSSGWLSPIFTTTVFALSIGAVYGFLKELRDQASKTDFCNRISPIHTKVLAIITTYDSLEEFLISYAWQRAITKAKEEFVTPAPQAPQDLKFLTPEQMQTVELFRKAWMNYFKNMPFGLKYPTSGELLNFVQLHWLIYQANNYCCNQYPDELVPTRFAHINKINWIRNKQPDLADKAEEYHRVWNPILVRIRREIWKDTPDRNPNAKPKSPPRPQTWWQWWHGYNA